jgi:hypothetical protein
MVIIGVDDGSFKMGQKRRKVWSYRIFATLLDSEFCAIRPYLFCSYMHVSEVNPWDHY